MSNTLISESFRITKEDFVNMQLEKRSLMIPKENKIILRILGMIAIACGTAAFINIRENIYQIICWILLIITGFYAVSYYDFIDAAFTAKNAADFYNYNEKDISSKKIEFTEEEFRISDEEHRLMLPKKFINRICIEKKTVFIFTDCENFYYIPKRILSEKQLQIIKEFV